MATTDDDPARDDARARSEAEGSALMAEGAARLLGGVDELGARWVVRSVSGILSAWGQLDAGAQADALTAATTAGAEASERVATELRALFGLDPADQRATPLEIIRSLRFEATAVLRDAGVPEVVRDQFEERSFPDDVYGIVIKIPAELGDDDLGGALLAWGLGKAKVLRARADQASGETEL